MPIQAGLNSRLSQSLGNPLLGSLISFVGGTLAMLLIIAVTTKNFPSLEKLQQTPAIYFLGGLLGASFVLAAIIFLPRLGATTLMISFILGQLIGSILLDHMGLLTNNTISIDTKRIIGVLLVFIGLIMVQKH